MAKQPKITLRLAKRNAHDAKLTQSFNIMHARFEDEEEALINTHDTFRRDLDHPTPLPLIMFAQMDGVAVGVAMYFPTFEISRGGKRDLWLDDLFLKPETRGKGAGRVVLAELARQALLRGSERLSWIVGRENKGGIAFYEKMGAVRDQINVFGKIEQGDIESAPERKLPRGYHYRVAFARDSADMARLAAIDNPSLNLYECEVTLRALLSGDHVPFDCFLVFHDSDRNHAVGMCVFFRCYSSWRGQCIWLDHIVVEEGHRRKGIGSALMSMLLSFTVKKEWQFPGIWYSVAAANDAGRRFLAKHGGAVHDQWVIYRLSQPALQKLADEVPSRLHIAEETNVDDLAIPQSMPVLPLLKHPRL